MNAVRIETDLTDAEFADYLTEIYGTVDICGSVFSSGDALRKLDPTAFRCAKFDHESERDSENLVFECGECEDRFDNEEDAESCCQPEGEPDNG